jgi:RNA polymerase sigma factor (sigma-70 family)
MNNVALKLSHSIFQKNSTSDYSNEKIINGILINSNETLEYIYKNYYSKIKKMVWSFRNTVLQPEDIFQEGLTRAIVNIQNGKFRGDSSFLTYLNSVCRNICLKELAKIRHSELGHDVELEEETENFELLQALIKVMNRIDVKCRNIIDMRFNITNTQSSIACDILNKSTPFEDIAENLNLSQANARQRFKRCLDKLREFVMDDSEIKEYYL